MKTYLSTLLLATTASFTFAQGPLTPPGLPAPSMKTLDQIEARTPISATVTPGAGPYFTISQPGSYYLTGNITVTTGSAIVITAASDVSIDLNGFTIASTSTIGNDGYAIFIPIYFNRLTVRNGSIRSGTTVSNQAVVTSAGFTYGIVSQYGLQEALISGLHVSGCCSSGIMVEGQGIIENCTASNNGVDGIFCRNGSVTGCTARLNGADGIVTILSSVTSCSAFNNGHHGINASSSVVVHCVASGNSTSYTSDANIRVDLASQRIGCIPPSE
jgi:hypothetical protein